MATTARRFLVVLFIEFTLLAHVPTAQAQPDSAAAAARHDPDLLMQVLGRLENEEPVRVEVPRNLLDLDNPTILTPRDRVVLYNPAFTAECIDCSRVPLPGWAEGAVESFPKPLPLSQVFRLEAHGTASVAGAWTGGILVGALALVTSFTDACSTTMAQVCVGDWKMVAMGLGGVAVGAFVGGVLGQGIKKWKTVYVVSPELGRGVLQR
jgi:hypothetical protein